MQKVTTLPSTHAEVQESEREIGIIFAEGLVVNSLMHRGWCSRYGVLEAI